MPDLGWISAIPAKVPEREDLIYVLEMFFQSHCTCALPAELRDRITFGAGTSSERSDAHGSACLGSVSIVDANLDDGIMGWIEIIPTRSQNSDFDIRYQVVIVYSGDRWLVYPAAPVLDVLQ
jgi:hypothetical protein